MQLVIVGHAVGCHRAPILLSGGRDQSGSHFLCRTELNPAGFAGTDKRQGWQGMGIATPRPAAPPAPPVKPSVTGVRIEHNSFAKSGKASKATLSLAQTAATEWWFDFCDVLIFKQIAITKVRDARSAAPLRACHHRAATARHYLVPHTTLWLSAVLHGTHTTCRVLTVPGKAG